jgi:hypothetical protein
LQGVGLGLYRKEVGLGVCRADAWLAWCDIKIRPPRQEGKSSTNVLLTKCNK